MSKKRDRKGSPPSPAPAPPPDERRPARGGGLFRGAAGQSPYPPFGASIARGLRAVLETPAVLAAAFLMTLAFWGAYVALGADPPPQGLVLLTGLPPVNVSLDVALVNQATESALGSTVLILGGALVRAAVIGALALLLAGRLQGEPPAQALRRLPRVTGVLFLMISIEIALVISVPLLLQSLLGPALGQLGIIAGLVLGLHYLGMAPAIAALEPDPPGEVLRRSVRAARLPGPRHLLLVVAYFSFVFWTASITPVGEVAPATPSVAVWAIALVASLVHMTVLGAFMVRWLAVREQVPHTVPRERTSR